MRIVIVDSDAQYIKIIEKTVRSLQKENENRGNEHEKAVCLAGAAQDGKAGYELIREKGPDLVIMDLDLPEPGGIFLLRKLRHEKMDMHVLILTEEADFGRARQAIELGIDNYMLKPVKTAQLKKAILQIGDKIEKFLKRHLRSRISLQGVSADSSGRTEIFIR